MPKPMYQDAINDKNIYLRENNFHISKHPFIFYFINTNMQSKMKISHLESFCLGLLSKKLVLLAENERLGNKLKSTNRPRDLIVLIKYPMGLFIGSLNQYLYM